MAAHARQYPVKLLCRVLGVARSGYYAWRRRRESQRQQQDRALTVQIGAIFTSSRRTYGSPRVHAELGAQGVSCARKLLARLMRKAGLHLPSKDMESFFGRPKTELAFQVYPSRAAAYSTVFEYIERFYNRQRRHSALGYLSPVAYEQRYLLQEHAA